MHWLNDLELLLTPPMCCGDGLHAWARLRAHPPALIAPDARISLAGGAIDGKKQACGSQLQLMQKAASPQRDTASTLQQLAPWVDISNMTTIQMDEKLAEVVSSLLDKLTNMVCLKLN